MGGCHETALNSVDVNHYISQIFIPSFLGCNDLKNVLQVCKKWKELGVEPNLWSQFQLVVTKENGGCLETILSMKRFSKVKILRVVRIKASCKELEFISSSKVVNLRLSKCMLKGIQPNVLSKVINSLKIVDFDHSRINSFQLKCLLTSITEETKLKYL